MSVAAHPEEHEEQSDRIRLHITPFNPELLDKIIPQSVQALASDISYHTVQTFLDRGFGYVELPKMEADKIKKRLNGSTLRGAKIRIEEARPEKKRKSDDDEEDGTRKVRRTGRKEKSKPEDGVIPGHELEEGRRVKRGWKDESTTSKKPKKKDSARDSASEAENSLKGKKLRFKTTVSPIMTPTDGKGKSKEKKRDDAKKGSRGKAVVVEEFSKTTKPALAPSEDESTASSHGATSYEDGKGWVDEDGNVVEAERPATTRRRTKSEKVEVPRISAIESTEVIDSVLSHSPMEADGAADNDDTLMAEAVHQEDDEAGPSSSAVVETEHEEPETQTAKEVHPLEALFKRPIASASEGKKRKPGPIDTSFSFFEQEAAAEANGENEVGMPPQTPRTKRDLEWRSLRSGAPTPDTAALGKRMSFPFPDPDEEDEEDEADGDVAMEEAEQTQADAAPTIEEGRGEESAFRKWFYEHRGDLNRGWKKRRRDEKKQKRQRENRRLSRKVA